MAAIKMTTKWCEAVKGPSKGRTDYYDDAVAGLVLRVTSSGSKSWSYYYRYGKKARRLTLGPLIEVSLADARDKARRAAVAVREGRDPAWEKREAKSRAEQEAKDTYSALVADYVAQVCRKRKENRTADRIERMLLKYAPEWESRPVATIRRRDVNEVLQRIAKDHEATSLYLYANLNSFFSWCVGLEVIEASPCHKSIKPAKAKVRNRPLTNDEIKKLWDASLSVGYPFGAMFRLALTTGTRRGECAGAVWSEIDLDAGEWTIPASRTKNKTAHTIPLSELAMDVLAGLPKFSGPHLFSTTYGTKPYQAFTQGWTALVEAAELQDAGIQFRDTRSTVATMMRSECSVQVNTISECLNHLVAGSRVTSKHYAKETDLKKMKIAFDKWANLLERIVTGETAKVVGFPRGRAR